MFRLIWIFVCLCVLLNGCANVGGGGYPTSAPTATPTGSAMTTTFSSTTGKPVTFTAPLTTPSPVTCSGRKIGTYAWSQAYWRGNDTTLLNFLDSDLGREWACGDLSINVADYSNPDSIHDSGMLVTFIQEYRLRVRDPTTVVWITYGDVVEKSGAKMLTFTRTFFKWVSAIPTDVAVSMGTIGISYDVEHLDPQDTKDALVLAQQLRQNTNFPVGSLLIQHTIEGDPNVVGTDYVMRYADSALAMVYRNYMHDPTGKYQDDSNILNRLMWMLTEQCVNCLNDEYAKDNYKAKITIMVEAACKMGASCGKISFCAFDGSTQGAYYMADILDQLSSQLISAGKLTQSQYNRLISSSTPYSGHNWEWYRCYVPFSSVFQYDWCASYHQYASSCRSE